MKRIYCLLPVFLVILGLFTSCAPPNAAKKKTSTSAVKSTTPVTAAGFEQYKSKYPCNDNGYRMSDLTYTFSGNIEGSAGGTSTGPSYGNIASSGTLSSTYIGVDSNKKHLIKIDKYLGSSYSSGVTINYQVVVSYCANDSALNKGSLSQMKIKFVDYDEYSLADVTQYFDYGTTNYSIIPFDWAE